MLSYLASEDASVPVQLLLDDEPFVPDDGDISWSVRGHDGSVALPTATMHNVTDTTAILVVPAAANELDPSRQLEKRTLLVSCTKGAMPVSLQVSYRIHAFLNHTVTPKDVRKFIGIDDGELPNDEIDLVDAFFDVAAVTTFDTLSEALAGDEKTHREGDKAIIAQAVINLLPSLQQRISKSDSDGTSKAERFTLDVEDIEGRARKQLEKAIVAVTGQEPTARTLTATSATVDPFTGA